MKLIKSSILPLLLLLCVFARADAPPAASTGVSTSGAAENLFAVLSMRGISSSLQGKDLTPAWRIMRVSGASEEGAFWQMILTDREGKAQENDFCYTRGDVVYLAGQSYLVAYRVQQPANDEERKRLQRYLQTWRNEDEGLLQTQAPPLEENTKLVLSLIALGKDASFSDIKAFDPEKDLLTPAAKAKHKVKIDRAASQSNLKQIGLAVMQYVQDYDEKFPPMRAARRAEEFAKVRVQNPATVPVQLVLLPYLKNAQTFLHPSTGRPYLPNYKLSRRTLAQIGNAATTFLFYEDAPDTEGKRNVAFADGHVEALKEADFQKRRIAQGISASGLPSAMSPTQASAARRAAEASAKKRGKPPLYNHASRAGPQPVP